VHGGASPRRLGASLDSGIGDELTTRHRRPKQLIHLRNHAIREPQQQHLPDWDCCDHCKNPGVAFRDSLGDSIALDRWIMKQRLMFVTLLYNEYCVRVFSTEAVEQLQSCRGAATASDSHEGVEVTPGRLDAPSTTLPAQQHRAHKAVGLLAAT
jgi:hypothetical protein